MADRSREAFVAGGRFRVLGSFSRGPFKRVHHAQDTRTGADVSLVELDTRSSGPGEVEALHAWADALAKLSPHPHLAAVREVIRGDRGVVLACAPAGGESLRARLDAQPERRLSIDEVCRIGAELAGALAHAHAHGVLHHAITPECISFDEAGRAVLGEFGRAPWATPSSEDGSSADRAARRAAAYVAPEQALGRMLDARTDLYALGAVLHEMVTGAPPFESGTVAQAISHHLDATPPASRALRPDVPPALDELITGLLAKRASERPAAADGVRTALAGLASHHSPDPGGPGPAPSHLRGLIGREAALRVLDRAIARVVAGTGGAISIVGEAGIGKTRLAEELSARAASRGATVLWGRSTAAEGSPPFWAWTQVLRALAASAGAPDARLGPAVREIAALLPELEAALGPPERRPTSPGEGESELRFRMFDAISLWLAQAAARTPLVLILDDLHFADRDSLRLLQFILSGPVRTCPVLVVATLRDGASHPRDDLDAVFAEIERHTESIPLAALSVAEVRELVAMRAHIVPDDATVERLRDQTAGNPLFLEELISLLREHDRISSAGALRGDPFELPAAARHAIAERVDRLDPSCRRALRCAAVVGAPFTAALLDTILAGDATTQDRGETGASAARHLDAAIRAKLVEPDAEPGHFRFRHGLVAEALYASLPADERAELHARIGCAIESAHGTTSGDALARLAHHFGRAAREEDVARAVEYGVRAARHAVAVLAYDSAVAHLQAALRLRRPARSGSALAGRGADPRHERCGILLELASAQALAGLVDDAAKTAHDAADLARSLEDPTWLARAALAFPYVLSSLGIMEERVDTARIGVIEAALERLDREETQLRPRLLACLALELYYAAPLARRRELCEEAVAIASATRDPELITFVRTAAFWALWAPGNAGQRAAMADELLELARESGSDVFRARALVARIHVSTELGDRESFDRHVQEFGRIAERCRRPTELWSQAVLRALCALLDGRLEDAERCSNDALSIGQRSQIRAALQAYGSMLFRLRHHQGRVAEVEPLLARYVEQFPSQWAWQCGLASFRAQIGMVGSALDHYRRVVAYDFAGARPDALWLLGLGMLSEAAVARLDVDTARRLYVAMEPYADVNLSIVGLSYGPCARCLAGLAFLLGRFDAAVRHFEHAVALAERTRDRPWLAHTLRGFACALAARGEAPERTRAVVSRARSLYREMGMDAHLASLPAVAEPDPEPVSTPAPAASARDGDRSDSAFRRDGDVWQIRYAGRAVRVADAKGLHYIAYLLERPECDVHVSDLVAAVGGGPAPDTHMSPGADTDASGLPTAGGEMLDATARDAYRRRLADLRDELAEAHAFNDSGRAERISAEIEHLERELRTALGLDGRARRMTDPIERMRKAVYNRIRHTVRQLDRLHPALAKHLASAIRTGTTCAYRPDRPIDWSVRS